MKLALLGLTSVLAGALTRALRNQRDLLRFVGRLERDLRDRDRFGDGA